MNFSNNYYSRAKWLVALVVTQLVLPLSQADITVLTSVVFYRDIQSFDLIVDARTAEEYAMGHIENATLVPELGLLNGVTLQQQEAAIARLAGCRFCRVAVYSSTGRKAMLAAEQLESIGGFAHLFNGLGITEWATAGYPLVTTRTRASASPCVGASQSFCRRNSGVIPNDNNSSNEAELFPEKKIVPRSADKDAFKLYTGVNTQGNVRRHKRVRG